MDIRTISGTGIIRVGHHLHVDSCSIVPTVIHTCKKSSIINIGNCVYVGPACEILASDRIDIGDYTLISPQTTIYDSDWHGIDGNETKSAPVKIGNHVWVCRSVIILKGVEIGDNSIIAAGSIVTKDAAESTLVAECPARKIRPTTDLTRSHWVEMRLKPER
jgi:acetyltransferase-like isoleucine patch superfamily enzyme